MKNLAILLIGLITLSSATFAATTSIKKSTAKYNIVFDGSKYVFVEDGIEFSLFPDGEFDFYIPEHIQGIDINAGPVGISFNTGYDYNPYVQYDTYGAVIQIEDTPIYYDKYGRLARVGDVRVNYRNNRITRIGGLFVYYDNYGRYSHYSGFINVYNRNYVFHPYHNFFYRPVFNKCLVWTTPYREYYSPIRYSYIYHSNNYYKGYNNGYPNSYRNFIKPSTGSVAHTNGRRSNVDRNNTSFRKVNTTRYGTNVASNSKVRNNSMHINNGNTNTTRAIPRKKTSRNERVIRGGSREVTSTNIKARTKTQKSVPKHKTTITKQTPSRNLKTVNNQSRTKVAFNSYSNRSSKNFNKKTSGRKG